VQEYVGCWEELRETSYITTVDMESAQPEVVMSLNQKWYLDVGQWLAYTYDWNVDSSTEYTTPVQFKVKMRFHAYDPRNMEEVNDVVEFVLISSLEDYADFCDFASLTLEPIANP
jgi:hypothetical protein